jgi:hypothetical protein
MRVYDFISTQAVRSIFIDTVGKIMLPSSFFQRIHRKFWACAFLVALLAMGPGSIWSHAQYVGRNTLSSPNPVANGDFGEDIAVVGDVDGDGQSDFVVGAPEETDVNDQAGRAYLISGADGSIIRTLESPDPTFEGNFGFSVSGIGDVGGDATPDLVVGAPGESGNGVDNSGRAYIIDGATGSVLHTLLSESSNIETNGGFGNAVAQAGDVGGDATPDILVGAQGETVNGKGEAGRAYLIDGADGSILRTLKSPNDESGGEFGTALVGLGDVGGDATPDVLIGAPGETESSNSSAGRAYVVNGADGSILRTLTSFNSTSGGLFGASVAAPGDLGGSDNAADYLVGATGESGVSNGRVYLIDGADGSKIQQYESSNPEDDGDFGSSIAEVGDVAGNSTPDLLIGAPNEDTNADGDVTDNQGRAYIVDGASATVIDVLASPNSQADGRFGDAVASLGDQDGDGTSELAVGAPTEDADTKDGAGRGYILTIPEVTFIDGKEGESYDPPSASSGDSDVPIGRFKLSSSDSRSTLESVTVSNEGTTVSGVNSIELWYSSDNSFETGNDTKLVETTYSSSTTFSGISAAATTGGRYFFVVLDLGSSPSGEYDPAIASEADIRFADGRLFEVNGTSPKRTFSVSNGIGYLSTGPTSPLPVELTRLAATASSDGVALEWRTASEQNNAGFRIQRRVVDASAPGARRVADGASEDWSRVGRVDGSGTTTTPQTYRFTDESLPAGADTLQYRLAQVDLDGTVNLSDPVTVGRGAPSGVKLLDTYPNPARTRATVSLAVPEQASGDATLRLYDVLGRQVRTVDGAVEPGRSTATVDVSGLPSGVYVLRLSADGTTRTRRLTVVK